MCLLGRISKVEGQEHVAYKTLFKQQDGTYNSLFGMLNGYTENFEVGVVYQANGEKWLHDTFTPVNLKNKYDASFHFHRACNTKGKAELFYNNNFKFLYKTRQDIIKQMRENGKQVDYDITGCPVIVKCRFFGTTYHDPFGASSSSHFSIIGEE